MRIPLAVSSFLRKLHYHQKGSHAKSRATRAPFKVGKVIVDIPVIDSTLVAYVANKVWRERARVLL